MIMNTEIQKFLAEVGYYRAKIDGDLGPKSRDAMRQVLGEHGWSASRLRVGTIQMMCLDAGIPPGHIDGIMGPKTRGAIAIFAARRDGTSIEPQPGDPLRKSVKPDMPWFERAQELAGTREIKGKRHNPVIMGWASAQKIWYPNDETPWCGLFVSHCIHHAMRFETQPSNPLGARNWLKFGRKCKPQLGAVLVFWRGKPDGWTGHVGFYAGEDANAYHVLGGNQSNEVNVRRIAKSRLLGARWPASAVKPPGIIRRLDARGRLSKNEA